MKVRWTSLALEDLHNAYEYVAADNPRAASAMIARIEAAVNSLRVFPDAGRPGRVEGTRELVVTGTPFIIPYRTKHRQVEILALIHAARRWPESF
ncbi:MAG: type II toxin-antitoxin system RelE/ParE family toxin [Terriglobia bacterium]